MSESQRPQNGKGILLYKKWRDLENEQKKQILREAEALFSKCNRPFRISPLFVQKAADCQKDLYQFVFLQ